MAQWIKRGSDSLSSSAPKPRRSAAPGARFWTKTSAPQTRRRSTSFAPSSFRFSVRDSLERLSQTKWLARPFTVVSYPRAEAPPPGRSAFIPRARGAVGPSEAAGGALYGRVVPAGEVPHPGSLDLYHAGAEVGELAGGEGGRDPRAQGNQRYRLD